jgi:hypothetical protein
VYPPPAFIWEGRNYLLKMHADLDFLADAQPLVTALRVASEKVCPYQHAHAISGYCVCVWLSLTHDVVHGALAAAGPIMLLGSSAGVSSR